MVLAQHCLAYNGFQFNWYAKAPTLPSSLSLVEQDSTRDSQHLFLGEVLCSVTLPSYRLMSESHAHLGWAWLSFDIWGVGVLDVLARGTGCIGAHHKSRNSQTLKHRCQEGSW